MKRALPDLHTCPNYGCSINKTCERGKGLLLIEVFRKLINPQIEGHLDHLQGAIFLFIRALDKRSYLLIRGTQINVEGFTGNPSFDLNSLLM